MEAAAEVLAGKLKYCLQIWLVVLVIQAQQGLEEMFRRLSGMELKVQVEIQQPEELEVFNSLRLSMVLFVAICYQDSFKS